MDYHVFLFFLEVKQKDLYRKHGDGIYILCSQQTIVRYIWKSSSIRKFTARGKYKKKGRIVIKSLPGNHHLKKKMKILIKNKKRTHNKGKMFCI